MRVVVVIVIIFFDISKSEQNLATLPRELILSSN